MTLDFIKLLNSIQDRLPDLQRFSSQQKRYREVGEELCNQLSKMDFQEFNSFLSDQEQGAIPVLEIQQNGEIEPHEEKEEDWKFIKPFPRTFSNHAQARDWAGKVLSNISVAAIDGSQVYPGNELTLPFGMVNIGWYINHHNGHYNLDHESHLLLPDQLGINPETEVNCCRAESEISKTVEILGTLKDRDLVFMDGSLVLSFVQHIYETTRKRYIDSLLSLLKFSQKHGAPLVTAYVDNSRATDLATMLLPLLSPLLHKIHLVSEQLESVQYSLSSYDRKQGNGRILLPPDAALISHDMKWGDRTSTFVCARDDILRHYRTPENDFSREICFFYIKTAHARISRVEFPRRILDEGLAERLADLVRAQVIVGDGYPHVLNRAHHEANVSLVEREKFIELLLKLSAKHDIDVNTSIKAYKKRG